MDEDNKSPIMKWLLPLLVLLALIVALLFLTGVFDADVDVEDGNLELPEVDAEVDVDLDVDLPEISTEDDLDVDAEADAIEEPA